MSGRPPRSPWHDWLNAAAYQSFVDDVLIYRWLNRQLAGLAQLEDAARVFDLACGTGATALACLPHLHRDSEIVGLDQSEAMVEIARAESGDPRCRFLVGDARRLRSHLERADDGRLQPFDRVVCNAALWQLPEIGRVLEQLAGVLEEGAKLVFNVPTQQLAPERGLAHPFQRALARELHEIAPDHEVPTSAFTSLDEVHRKLERAGFAVELDIEASYAGEMGELVDLMQIPAMSASLAPEIPASRCHRAVLDAAAHVDRGQPVTVPWTFIRAELRDPATRR